jgi:hypothetical protein
MLDLCVFNTVNLVGVINSIHRSKQDRQCTFNVTLRRVSAVTVAAVEQQALRILREFKALDIQHAMRVHHIVVCCLPISKILFLHYLIQGTILEKSY